MERPRLKRKTVSSKALNLPKTGVNLSTPHIHGGAHYRSVVFELNLWHRSRERQIFGAPLSIPKKKKKDEIGLRGRPLCVIVRGLER